MNLTARRKRVIELLVAGQDIYKATAAVYKCNSERSLQAQVNQLQNDVDFVGEYLKRIGSEPTIDELSQRLWAIVNTRGASIRERLTAIELLYDILQRKRAQRNAWRREHDRLVEIAKSLEERLPKEPVPDAV